jgi:hypothetical protein
MSKASIRAIKRRINRTLKPQIHTGRRCRLYATHCARCDTHRFLLQKGRYPHNFDELWEFMHQHDVDAPAITWAALAAHPDYALLTTRQQNH